MLNRYPRMVPLLIKETRCYFIPYFLCSVYLQLFFLLGMSFTALGSFFKENRQLFTKIGGILIILLGLFQIGFLDFKFLQKEHKFHINIGDRNINPLIAYIMGFAFSFAWTPCVGPALSSILIMASGSSSVFLGNLLVLIYSIGFIIPFLLLGLFTTQALNFLKKYRNLLKYTVKAAALLLILIGIMTYTGWMNGISGYLNQFTPKQSQNTTQPSSSQAPTEASGEDQTDDKEKPPAYDFTLTDQYGKEHTLSDYKGKVLFLNFWATWCPPCKQEMPDIEVLYQEYGKNEGDIIILGVANPKSEAYPNNSDGTKDEVIAFLEENDYTFPVLFDETGDILSNYYISAFPTTFLIDEKGNVFGYAAGMLSKDIMINAIKQTIDSTK